MSGRLLEITKLVKIGGPLSKRISLAADGRVISDGSACVMSKGEAHRICIADLDAFADLISGLQPHEAIALGTLRDELPDRAQVVTKEVLAGLNGQAPPNMIARTGDDIAYRSGHSALALIDVDVKGMPDGVKARIKALGGLRKALESVVPDLAEAACVIRTSTSSGLYRSDTGEQFTGSGGFHLYVMVTDGAEVEHFLRRFHDRSWLAGLGWMMLGVGGQLLERSLVDRMVYAAERLVFEGAPSLVPPLTQDTAARRAIVQPGRAIDAARACSALTLVEKARLGELRRVEAARLKPEAAAAKAEFVERQAKVIAERRGMPVSAARRVVEQQTAGILLPAVVLPFDASDMAGCTVADALADPARFAGATLADPLEGVEYGRCKAKVMRRSDGTLWVNSFAHGRTTYDLKHDAPSIEAAIHAAPESDAADLLTTLLLAASIEPDDEQRLRALVIDRAKIKAKPLADKIKAGRQRQEKQRADEQRDWQAAARTDLRIYLAAPPPDAERLPVLQAIDEVLVSAKSPEPPMRDLDGQPVEVRARQPLALHELTGAGANGIEASDTRLPAPEMPLLTRHDKCSLAHAVERHIEYFVFTERDGERSVALPPIFVEHYAAYRDSRLPRVGGVVTNPLVMPDGTLLAPIGLDRQRRLVFRIPPSLLPLLPDPAECRLPEARAEAMEFLLNDWLVDVSTDLSGKCVMIAAALTILQRVLLPERPAFFITAGQRGGGKTTATTMLTLAATGRRPAAAAWSPNDEERRKAILAYLSEGLPALVWDNIPRGAAISCPTIEKVLTAEQFSDRVLGESTSLTVQATTVLLFTGNNIAPRGDLASRSLSVRIQVNRADPENRPFRHANPIAWTMNNRGAILRALYTVLLGNPQLQPATAAEPKTRFKIWWNLVGSAVEAAAKAYFYEQEVGRGEFGDPVDVSVVDFGKMFLAFEADDEQGSALTGILDILMKQWGSAEFTAKTVARLIESPMDGEAERAGELRSLLDQVGDSRRPMPVVTAYAVSTRLRAIADAPADLDGKTVVLKRIPAPDKKNGTTAFQVVSDDRE